MQNNLFDPMLTMSPIQVSSQARSMTSSNQRKRSLQHNKSHHSWVFDSANGLWFCEFCNETIATGALKKIEQIPLDTDRQKDFF